MVGYLVEEDIFSVSSFCGKVFEITIFADSVFLTQLLPKLRANLPKRLMEVLVRGVTVVAALAGLDGDELSVQSAFLC